MSSPSSLTLVLVLVVLGLIGADREAVGAEFFIEMFSGAFLPSNHTIDVGDTVTWVWVSGDHELRSGVPGGAVGTPDEPGAIFSATVDAANPSFSHVFTTPGTINFHDALSPAQIGFIQVSGDEMTFSVAVLDNDYEPATIAIFIGDSVSWEHVPGEMFHTVTSGASSDPADNPGALFNAASSDQEPVFVYPFDFTGDQPYFCIPHEQLGMVGLVRIQDRFIRGDANRNGTVDVADAVSLLGVLFQGNPAHPCADASDANDDGNTDVGDAIWILGYLFSGTPAPPPPFPTAGPDRTDDPLLCMP
jgi:plastocyanin